jgi:hypothetical protein
MPIDLLKVSDSSCQKIYLIALTSHTNLWPEFQILYHIRFSRIGLQRSMLLKTQTPGALAERVIISQAFN